MNNTGYEYTERVLKYIKENHLLTAGDTVVVGLSGGPDSVCLLYILKELSKRLGIRIEAVHVHHGIRGVSADNDEQFCINMCKEMDINICSHKCDIPEEAAKTGESLEECARRIRYEILRKHAVKYKSAKIAVAHHIDDQAETVIFRMIRGTGVKGLSAMRPQNGDIIRPLLCMTRSEVMSYLENGKISYCVDETNLTDDYSRNRIRLNIIPEAEKISPAAVKHIAELSEEAAEIADYLDKCAEELLKQASFDEDTNVVGKTYKVDVLNSAERVIVLNSLRKIVNEMLHSLKDVTRTHIEAAYRLLSLSEAKSINLPKGLIVSKEGNRISFVVADSRESDIKRLDRDYCEELKIPGDVILPEGSRLEAVIERGSENFEIPQKIYTKWLDYDKIKGGLCVRFRRCGDYLIVDEKGTKKSLSRYMIDEKVPKNQRDFIPVLACESEILWVIGHRISAHYKISRETENIIRLEVKGEGNE